jgi:DNA-binding transcriptional ArsR family regulator
MVKYKTEEMFAALGQPVRRKMVERLATRGPLPLSVVAEPFDISLPAALKHSRILEEAGLIVRKKVGRVQYCAVNADAFDEMLGWLLAQKRFWDASFARLEREINNRKK